MTSNDKLNAVIAYLFGWISGLIYLAVEKANDYVRFHAAQSIAITGTVTLVSIALRLIRWAFSWIPVLGLVLSILITIMSIVFGLAVLVFWILIMINAGQGRRTKLPFFGDFAENTIMNWFK